MLRTLLVLSLWVLSTMTHFAGADEPEVDTWFADYDELTQMTEGDRKAYLSEMRNIISDYEFNSHESLAPYRSAMIDFSLWLPEAEAAKPDEGKVCTKKGEVLEHYKDEKVCVLNVVPGPGGTCPNGSDLLAHTNGGRGYTEHTNLCYTRRVTSEGGIEQVCPNKAAPNCATIKGKWDCLCPNDANAKPTQIAQAEGLPEKAAPAKGKGAAKEPAPPAAAPAAAEKPAPAVKEPKKVEKKADAKPDEKHVEKKPAEHKADAAPAPKPACRAAIPNCDAGGADAAREEFFLQKRACVYAGNISKYRKKKPAKGDCEPVTSVTLGEKNAYSCTEGVLCNPLVYCVPKAGEAKGYCSKNKSNSTAKCDQIAPKSPDCLNKLLSSVPREAWNGFLKSLKQVCSTDQPSAKYHCKECSIMYRRIFALNSVFTKSVCTGGTAKAAPGTKTPKAAPATPTAPPTESSN